MNGLPADLVLPGFGEGSPAKPEMRDGVTDAVRHDLHRRSQLGLAKYGQPLSANTSNHRERLQHAYEEALDLCQYLKWSIMQLDAAGVPQKNEHIQPGFDMAKATEVFRAESDAHSETCECNECWQKMSIGR